MLVLELTFLAGRYHATPWGRHVNEGVPEWPPSPYRLVRALYDAWRRKRPEWPEARVEPLLAALATAPPSFRLPPASASHTRSYLSANAKDLADRKLVFDAFVAVDPRAPVLLGWPEVSLEPSARADLAELLGLLSYLGRSEAWVDARVLDGVAAVDWNCTTARGTGDPVRVAGVVPVSRFSPPDPGAPKRGRKVKAAPLTWLYALGWSSGEGMDARLSDPPALAWVTYQRPADCLDVAPRAQDPRPGPAVHGALYALESKVLPPVTATLEVAEQVHRRLMGIHKRLVGDPERVSQRFSGRDDEGQPLVGHRHMYVLPLDQDRDGRLDHLLILGSEALDEEERRALDRLESLWQRGGRPEIRCVPVRWGAPAELLAPCTRVISATPFVPPRHHRRGRGPIAAWVAAEVIREAENHGLPRPTRVTPVARATGRGWERRWLEFRRSRKGELPRVGYGFELEFAEPVPAPFALGYASHFGLGLFIEAR